MSFICFSDLSAVLGGAYAIQYFFAGTSIIAFFFALLFLPETHGKKLSDIEAYFKGNTKTKPTLKKSANNRKPKQTLQTVNESEKMMNGPENVWTKERWKTTKKKIQLINKLNDTKRSYVC